MDNISPPHKVQPGHKLSPYHQSKYLIREEMPIIIENHPHYKSLNSKLLQDAESMGYPESYKSNVKAKMSNWQCDSKNINIIKNWVKQILVRDCKFDPTSTGYHLDVIETWFSKYDKGDYTNLHSHINTLWSFVYFINCPKGSSPLIFKTSGKKIKAEEGKLVIFPGTILHYVPQNKCENRVVLAGNVINCYI